MILSRINKGVYLCLSEHANTSKCIYEHNCSSMRVFLSILAYLAQVFISNMISEYILNILIPV